MDVTTLIRWFETWSPPAWQENWDNCGWQVEPGIGEQPAIVLVCLTPTLAVIQEAIALRKKGIAINLIVAHHPLIFHPLKSLRVGRPLADLIQLAFLHQIGIYTAHTNFDQAVGGVSDVLGQLFNLQSATPMVSMGHPSENRGYGRVGNLVAPTTLSDLLQQIQVVLQPVDLTFSPEMDKQQLIQRLAVLGGSGAGFLDDALASGAQAYLTADCKFHQFQESRDRGLILIDAGHYATERPACNRLVQTFRQQGVAWVGLSEQDEDFRQFFSTRLIRPDMG